jgi:hypothetical protein
MRRTGSRRFAHLRLPRARLIVIIPTWVAVFAAAATTLTAAKAPVASIVATGVVAVLGLMVIAMLTTAEQGAEQRREGANADVPEVELSPRERLELVERVWRQRIRNGLERSLQHAVEMQLGLRQAPELLQLTYQQTSGRSGDSVDLVHAYESSGRQLVILGAPGSGKTTQALLLMRHLLDVARRDPSAPVPEVFQLASWARGRQPLLEWLTDQLQRRHGYRPSLGRSQLVHRHIIPVLDGLDEVASEHQPACATEITRFWMSHGGGPIVLCSRLAEYEELPEHLPFGGAVTVETPSAEQVERYLTAAGPGWHAVRATLASRANPALSDLLTTPLMLSVAVLAYRDRDAAELCTIHDATGQARQLWAAYVRQMCTRGYDPLQSHPAPYAEAQTVRWLSWLASVTREANETELWLHEPVGPPALLREIHLVSGLGVTLLVGLVVGALVGLGFGVGSGLVSGLGVGLLSGLATDLGVHTYRVPSSLARIVARTGAGIIAGLLVWLVIGGGSFTAKNLSALAVALAVGLVSGLTCGLADGKLDRTRAAIHSHNQVSAVVHLGLAGGVVAGLAGLSVGLVNGCLIAGLLLGLPVGLVVALVIGLGACGGHYVYRLLLWRKGWAPFRWGEFLDWACSHLYLRSAGPAYQWMHLELRDHLADQWSGAAPPHPRLTT